MPDDLLTPSTASDGLLSGEQVSDLYSRGIRCVALDEPVSLRSPTPRDLRALDFVRNATGRGLLVRWHLRAGRRADPALTAHHLTHLQPRSRSTAAGPSSASPSGGPGSTSAAACGAAAPDSCRSATGGTEYCNGSI